MASTHGLHVAVSFSPPSQIKCAQSHWVEHFIFADSIHASDQASVQHAGMSAQTEVMHVSASQSWSASTIQLGSQFGPPLQQDICCAQVCSMHESRQSIGSRALPAKQTECGQAGQEPQSAAHEPQSSASHLASPQTHSPQSAGQLPQFSPLHSPLPQQPALQIASACATQNPLQFLLQQSGYWPHT